MNGLVREFKDGIGIDGEFDLLASGIESRARDGIHGNAVLFILVSSAKLQVTKTVRKGVVVVKILHFDGCLVTVQQEV